MFRDVLVVRLGADFVDIDDDFEVIVWSDTSALLFPRGAFKYLLSMFASKSSNLSLASAIGSSRLSFGPLGFSHEGRNGRVSMSGRFGTFQPCHVKFIYYLNSKLKFTHLQETCKLVCLYSALNCNLCIL